MTRWLCVLLFIAGMGSTSAARAAAPADDERMDWWREARFGLFIHWGLYSTLEGEWNGETRHAEWIRTTARIPVDEYDTLIDRFNPVKFDADEWCRMARAAGMKYVVITSKHHDGFCLFDSEHTDFDVMSTPFKRDIMAELAEAAERHGLKMCWYHSIMDWHHPDYLPRRGWERADRPEGDADFRGRYVPYLRAQVTELLTNYGDIGVMWFDGEWESTWRRDLGKGLYDLCLDLQPDVIVNNRVSTGRGGMGGFTNEDEFGGDFGTPEQEVPHTGLPGVDWESCITMNDRWGWNKHDDNWKSERELIEMLCDIASKGGNLLLNVGPKPDGTFPQESIDRLAAIGRWMDTNGEAIHGTTASPFEDLEWGRCTVRRSPSGSTLYFHVFDRSGQLRVPGLGSPVLSARLLGGGPVTIDRFPTGIAFTLPEMPDDAIVPVVAIEVEGEPIVYSRPRFNIESDIFVGQTEVRLDPAPRGVEIRYTTNGSAPGPDSPIADKPILVDRSTMITARMFVEGRPVSDRANVVLRRVEPSAGRRGAVANLPLGLARERYKGTWDRLPNFDALEPDSTDRVSAIAPDPFVEHEAWRITGWFNVEKTGVYRFFLMSDDGSRLTIDDEVLIANDGLHGAQEMDNSIALSEGWHPIAVEWFNKTGGAELRVLMGPVGEEPTELSPDRLRQRD